jgi:hypothetical protein
MTSIAPVSAVFLIAMVPTGLCAQSVWTDRGYVNVSGGYRATTIGATDSVQVTEFVEQAQVVTTYFVRRSPELNVGAGARLWRNLAVGATVSYLAPTVRGDVSSAVPHPFLFNRPRQVSGSAAGLSRVETGVHVQATWVIPLRSRWQVALGGGPSLFRLAQSLVQDLTIAQAYPFDTATFSGAASTRVTRSAVGFNAVAGITYFAGRRVGAGTGLSFSRATVRLPSPDGDTVKLNAGGATIDAGIRFRF